MFICSSGSNLNAICAHSGQPLNQNLYEHLNMEAETTRVLLDSLFVVIGIALFAAAIATKLKMEKEFKGGTQRLPNNFFLYLDSSDFSRHGNTLRKRYNIIYAVLMVYSIVLFIFMRASG